MNIKKILFLLFIICLFTLFFTDTSFSQSCSLPIQQAYKIPGLTSVFYITENCTKRAFNKANIFFTYFDSWANVKTISATTLNSIPNDGLGFMPYGPKYDPKYGALVKTVNDPKVYLLLGNEKYWITSEDVFNNLNYSWNWIEDIDQRLLDKYQTASEINYTNHHPNYTLVKYANDAKVYRLEPDPNDSSKQIKKYIQNETEFNALGFRWDRIVQIGQSESYADNGSTPEPMPTKSVGCQHNNPSCGSDYDCVNNQCIKKQGCIYGNPSCNSNYNCVNNQCVSTLPIPPVETPTPTINDSQTKLDLGEYFKSSASSWIQKIPTFETQDVLDSVEIRPGALLNGYPGRIYFHLTNQYKGKISSINFIIEDVNTLSNNFDFIANKLENDDLFVDISVEQVKKLGNANFIKSFVITTNDGQTTKIVLSNVLDVININKTQTDEPIENYTFFSYNNIFLLISNKDSLYGQKIATIVDDCFSKIGSFYNQLFTPSKQIVIMEGNNLFYDTASFGSIHLGDLYMDVANKLNSCVPFDNTSRSFLSAILHEATHSLVANSPLSSAWANEGLATYSHLTFVFPNDYVCLDNSFINKTAVSQTPILYDNLSTFAYFGSPTGYITPYCFWKTIENKYGQNAIKNIVANLLTKRSIGIVNNNCSPAWSSFFNESVRPNTDDSMAQIAKDNFGLDWETRAGKCQLIGQ